MKARRLHGWNLSPAEAVSVQHRLAAQIVREGSLPSEPRLVAGIDLSAEDAQGRAKAAVVVLHHPSLEVAEVAVAEDRVAFPYIPGLLSFRESPVIVQALEQLSLEPDLVMVDGQGLAHPRRFGIACHLGLLMDRPTLGCAKSILRGTYANLGSEAGSTAELVDRGEVVGMALRTRSSTSPVYISIGHRIDLASAVRWTLACCRGYRLPEPTRLAHLAAAGRLPAGAKGSQQSRPMQQGALW